VTTLERSLTGQKIRWFSTQSRNPAVLQSCSPRERFLAVSLSFSTHL
jgi:hypothetical protein